MPGVNDQPFRCEVHVRGTAAHIRPVGELDIATCSLVEAHLVDCAAAGFEQLTFDLRALSFLDATGLRLILLWNTMSRTEGFVYRLIAGPPDVQRLFNLSGTRKRLDFVDMSQSAIRLRLGTPRSRGLCRRGVRPDPGLGRMRGGPRVRGAPQ
jgi:anti-anti-sigma factor